MRHIINMFIYIAIIQYEKKMCKEVNFSREQKKACIYEMGRRIRTIIYINRFGKRS